MYFILAITYGNYRESTYVFTGIIALLLAILIIYLGFPLIGLNP